MTREMRADYCSGDSGLIMPKVGARDVCLHVILTVKASQQDCFCISQSVEGDLKAIYTGWSSNNFGEE